MTLRTLTIRRLEEGPHGTFGVAYDDRGFLHLSTLERNWIDVDKDGHRDRNVSRIAAGEYEAFRRMSPKRGYEVFEFADAPDIDNAQIHIANVVSQLEGCIAVGRQRGETYLTDDPAPGLLDSRDAFKALMRTFPEPRIRVVIHDIEPGD